MRESPWRKRRLLVLIVVSAMLLPMASSGVKADGSWKNPIGWAPTIDQNKIDALLKKAMDAEKLGEEYGKKSKKWEPLSPEDGQYEPDYDPAGMPELPTLCKDSEKCEACFDKPYKELNNLRFRFEKLRKINRVTKNMLRDSIAFGDGMSNLAGGVVPLVWAKEKEKIRLSEANFNRSYDAKYQELMATLKATLQAIAECEEKVFGEQSWYERFGFIYYQFMAGAYQRPD